MEAAAGFGLAANVLQVVDFAYKILSTGDQIYQAGTTVQNSELEVALKDFTILNKRLKSWVRPNPDILGPLEEDGQASSIHYHTCKTTDTKHIEPRIPHSGEREDCARVNGCFSSSTYR
jgi:hypothetical protein